ncbi:hypothetical protein EVJ58_g6051 [Rhodofomes roseus]|uniref:DUF6532 domain-containing protein n=1 Tax=Rhodofomes roseus TaxID=34475 RepID=A0A4Y9YB90_9APHY|nr:hypothetical protein EVJ58_g6051 [Rhodofomes roseus]
MKAYEEQVWGKKEKRERTKSDATGSSAPQKRPRQDSHRAEGVTSKNNVSVRGPKSSAPDIPSAYADPREDSALHEAYEASEPDVHKPKTVSHEPTKNVQDVDAMSSDDKGSDNDDGLISGGEQESEEDFGIDLSLPGLGTKRKNEKVEQQLNQGKSKFISAHKSVINKTVNTDEEDHSDQDYRFPSSGDESADDRNGSGPEPHDAEWQRAAQPSPVPPAEPSQANLKHNNDTRTVEHDAQRTVDQRADVAPTQATSTRSSVRAVTNVGAHDKSESSTRYVVEQPTVTQKKVVKYGTAAQRARASKKVENNPSLREMYWPEGAKPIDISSDSGDEESDHSATEIYSNAKGKRRVLPKKTALPKKASKAVTMPPKVSARVRDGSNKDRGSGDESSGVDDSQDPDLLPKMEPIAGEKRWPPETHLTYNQQGKVVGINAQRSSKIKTLLSDAIAHALPRALLRVNAYPTRAQRPDMFLDILVDTSARLGLNDITLRLLDDSTYAQDMMKLPIDRMCTVRGPMFDTCRDVAWEGYGLKALEEDPAALKKAVTALLTDNEFICPGKLVQLELGDLRAAGDREDLAMTCGAQLSVSRTRT